MRTLTREEAARRAALLEVASYDVALDLTTGEDGFDSTTVVRFTCREPGASSFLELDGEVQSARCRGLELAVEGNRVRLDDLEATNEVTVVARCAYSRSGEGLHRFVDPADGEVYLWAQGFLDDAQRMFACFDQPDLKAPLTVSVRAPQGWTVVLNGRALQDGPVWTGSTPPLPPYLVHLSAGPWHGVRRWHRDAEHGDVELGLWCRRSLAAHLDADADELFEVTAQCLDAQRALFGRPYPWGDTYDQLFVPEFNHGAMENPGAVTFSEDFVPRSRTTQGARRKRAMVVAHEMAHMWFGDLVTMRWWDDLWLSESFAELLGYATVDRATAFTGSWLDFCTSRKAWGYRADAAPTTHPVVGDVADNRSAMLNFDGISYAKGASVLRQLSVALGEDVFSAGVRDYLAEHAWGNTCFDDLRAALERASGRDLGEWARAWLHTSGTSLLRPEVSGETVTVLQEGGVAREHRTAVGRYGLRNGRLVLLERVPVDVAGERTPTGAAPADLLLLNDGDLTFARTRFDPTSLATVCAHLAALDDPLARALCTASLWDALRDGELAATAYLSALGPVLAVEDDPTVLETLHGQVRTAATAFSAEPARARAVLAASCAGLARAAEPGSDLQLVHARAWASTEDGPAALASLLDGGLPGLAVDPDLRWHLLCRLAATGGVDAALVEQERAADRTAAGQRAAAYARSALPDADGKAAVWDEVTTDAGLSNHTAAALAGGFWQPGQDALLAPWVARYVEQVGAVWEARTPELARSTARLLFPSTLVGPDVLAEVDGLLARDLPAGLRRVVLEQRDDLARALRGRAVDTAADEALALQARG